jgi:hypothetical protein
VCEPSLRPLSFNALLEFSYEIRGMLLGQARLRIAAVSERVGSVCPLSRHRRRFLCPALNAGAAKVGLEPEVHDAARCMKDLKLRIPAI